MGSCTELKSNKKPPGSVLGSGDVEEKEILSHSSGFLPSFVVFSLFQMFHLFPVVIFTGFSVRGPGVWVQMG